MERTYTDWRQVIVLWVVGLLAAAQFGKASLALDPLRQSYARPDPELALIVSAVGVAGIFLGAVAGILVGRLGARRVLLWAIASAALLSLLQAAMPSYWLLLGLRGIEGIAHLALVVACPVLIAAAARAEDRSMVMALWASFFGVSFAVSALIIPVLESWGGLNVIWLAHGVALLVLWPLAAMWTTRANVPKLPWLGLIKAHQAIYTDPKRIAPGLAFFWHTVLFIALLTFLPEQLADPVPQALIAACLPLAALVGIFGAGALARRIPPLTLCFWSFFATAVLTPGLLFMGGWALFPYVLCVFVLIGAVPGSAFAAIPAFNHKPEGQAEANGALAQLGNIGTASGPLMYAFAIEAGALFGAAALTVGFCLCGVATVLTMRRIL